MEQFVVSARKYRPATFDTVVGQSSITTTLQNAIKNHHLAQAFLFCGPRGVGKTTCARILAKTINCENITSNTEPCNTCDSCISFNDANSLNIYELDAASNNSVDDIRSLTEQVRFAPHQGKFKIYIIDEVHMLSPSAFNAFLKTLEEPPPYAIFILATTEKHKIIPTILSRCQIYDFNRIQIEDIADHLARIAQKENVVADSEALHLIAQKADGALRDALSIFDQVVSFAGNKVTYEQVLENLNILDYDYFFRLTSHILSGDVPSSLLLINEIINKGFDGHNFITGLGSHFRNLLMCRNEATVVLLETSTATKEKYKTQAASLSSAFLFQLLEISNRCDLNYKSSKNPRLLVELALMKMCQIIKPNDQEANSPLQKKNDSINETPALPKTKEIIPVVETPQTIIPAKSIDSVPRINQSQYTVNETPRISRTVSISSFTSKVEEQQRRETNLQVGTESFGEDKLKTVWKKYAEKMLVDGRKSLYAALSGRDPILKDNFEIEFEAENLVNFSSENKTELLEFLIRELNNSAVKLEIILKRQQEEKPTPYSTSEKFKRMAEKNPHLNELKNQFDLEIDF